jgi:hypothetical protein
LSYWATNGEAQCETGRTRQLPLDPHALEVVPVPRDLAEVEPKIFAGNDASHEFDQSPNGPESLSTSTATSGVDGFPNFSASNLGNNNLTSTSVFSTASWQHAAVHDRAVATGHPIVDMGNSALEFDCYAPNSMYSPVPDHARATGFFPQQGLRDTNAQNNAGFQGQYTMPAPTTMQPQLFPGMITGTAPYYLPTLVPAVQRTPCSFCAESFARPGDLDRHWQSVHLGIKHHCFWLGCHNNRGKGYCRIEKLRTHQKQKHGFAWV